MAWIARPERPARFAMSGGMRHRVRMRIILSDFISLDGVVQAPGGKDEDTDGGFQHGGWSMPFFDPEAMGAAIGEVMDRTDALLFGRRTWDGMAAAWPGRAGDPFADQMNAIPKYVVSRTLSAEEASSRWNNTTLLVAATATRSRRSARCERAAVTAACRSGAARRWLASSWRTTSSTSTAHARADPARRREDDLPRRRARSAAGARVGHAGEDRRAHLRLPPVAA